MSSLPYQPESQRTVRLSHRMVYLLTAVVMAVVGTLCSTAALAAGVYSPDMLALVFSMGAAAALFLLLVWYILQLEPH